MFALEVLVLTRLQIFQDSRSLRSLVPVVVGLLKASQSSDGFFLSAV
jgi:hypothetical protein